MINIKEVFKIASTDKESMMVAFIIKELIRMKVNYFIDDFGNIAITKGKVETYPTFTAHLDTVHEYRQGFNLVSSKDNSTLYALNNLKQSVGVGGDDKCGIYVCLRLLEELDNIKVVFFSTEEMGCIGSSYFDQTFFANSRFIGGIDRKGSNDFATSYSGVKTVSDSFLYDLTEVVKKYDRREVTGGLTDAFNIDLDISCFNMSCGYYYPHTNKEYVIISEVEDTLDFCLDIVEAAVDTYSYKRPLTSYANYNVWEEEDFYRSEYTEFGVKSLDELWESFESISYEEFEEGLEDLVFSNIITEQEYEYQLQLYEAIKEEELEKSLFGNF